MKRVTIFLMIIALCFGMAACSGKKDQENKETETPTAPTKTSKIEVTSTNHYLGLHRSEQVSASIIDSKGEQLDNEILTWTSSDDSVVQVTQDGWLQAQGKAGTATVEISAENAETKILNITVEDYANPVAFSDMDKVEEIDAKAAELITKYKDTFCKVAAFLEKYKYEEYTLIHYSEYDQKMVVDGSEYDITPIETELESLTTDEGITIQLYEWGMTFALPETGSELPLVVVYNVYGDDANLGGAAEIIRMAPCWTFVEVLDE
jgi:hypothetical protein